MTLPLSPSYRTAIGTALALQVPLMLLLLMVLDGGFLAKVGASAMAGFWVGAAIVMFRRPRNPGALDLLYVRFGYIAMLTAGIAIAIVAGKMKF